LAAAAEAAMIAVVYFILTGNLLIGLNEFLLSRRTTVVVVLEKVNDSGWLRDGKCDR
jgi:hypothetical protein